MTYHRDPPGLQIFTMVQPAIEGGESVFVDGFAVAEELQSTDPADAFHVLSNTVRRCRNLWPQLLQLFCQDQELPSECNRNLQSIVCNKHFVGHLIAPPTDFITTKSWQIFGVIMFASRFKPRNGIA